MTLLDTDHLSILIDRYGAGHDRLVTRLQATQDLPLAAPIVALEEQCRGWLAHIKQARQIPDQIFGYGRLQNLFRFYADWEIAPFDVAAADKFSWLRRQKIRV